MGKYTWRLASFFAIVLISVIFTLTGCKKDSSVNPADQQQNTESGKLLYEGASDGIYPNIHQFDFATKTDKILMRGNFPSRLPDGRIVFVYGPGDIKISNPDGSNQTYLFQSSGIVIDPQVSSDGNFIAFSNINPLATGIIAGSYVYKTDGTKVSEFKWLFDPSWTPDGRLIMAGTYNTGMMPETPHEEGLYITDKQLTTATKLDLFFKKPLMPSVSPDGKLVAFVLDGHIWKMNIDGTMAAQVTQGNSEEKYPSWSPDGKKIAFNGFGSDSLIGIVRSDILSEVNNDAKCWVYSKENKELKSESHILWY